MKSHLYLSIFYVSNFEPTYYFCIYTFISYYHPSTYLQRKKNRMWLRKDFYSATKLKWLYISVTSVEQLNLAESSGQRSMKTAIKSSRPLVHFSNKGQKLGIILENKLIQNSKLWKTFSNKKCSPKFIFLDKKKLRKIRMIFDIENWLWKSDFGLFWPSLLKWTKGLELFHGRFHRPLALLIHH